MVSKQKKLLVNFYLLQVKTFISHMGQVKFVDVEIPACKVILYNFCPLHNFSKVDRIQDI